MPQRKTGKPGKSRARVSPPEVPPEIEIAAADDLPTYYSNQAQVTLHPFDFRIEFRQLKSTGEKIVGKPLAQVYVSPQHGKSLLALLARQVARYEEAFGALPDPDETVGRMQSAVKKVQEEMSDDEEQQDAEN